MLTLYNRQKMRKNGGKWRRFGKVLRVMKSRDFWKMIKS